MGTVNLTVAPGTWIVADCGKMPSERGCKLVMMAPESQKADLESAGIGHMVRDHGHTEADARTAIEEHGDEIYERVTVT